MSVKSKLWRRTHNWYGPLKCIFLQHLNHISSHTRTPPLHYPHYVCSMEYGMTSLTLSQWSSSGNPVAIQCAWNLDPSVHWNGTGEMPVCFQWSSSGFPVAFQWSSSVFQLCKLTLDRHWDTTGCKHQPVWFQWHLSVLVAPVVFQCVPIMQINTGSPLGHHWVLASASVVPVASQCTYGSSGLPVWSVQWYPSVLT